MIPATLEYQGPLLKVRFREPQICLSWAMVNGGRVRTACVAWYYLDQTEEAPVLEPAAMLCRKLDEAGVPGAVGLVTSRRRYGVVESKAEYGSVACWCMATVGLRNAVRVGDPPYELPEASTINVLCWISSALNPQAELEALSLASEGRTAAILDAKLPNAATGTGTDCIVLAHPGIGSELAYAGKHTPVGHVIGHAVYDAVHRGAREWLDEQDEILP